ncbi:MAG: hypothetical protein LBR69_07695 [Endomicrobium sp.]|nr:hypothetical protein [Endomicrobium sp.]
MTEITLKSKSPFEEIKVIDENGIERWYARDLSELLQYGQWRNFENVLEKAIVSAKTIGADVNYHFADISKMIHLAKGANREIKDFALSRYACYLVIQNADPAKPLVSIGQTYFAIQTRRQELSDRNMEITENEKRLLLRNEMKFHNKKLASAAKEAGVERPLDYMGSTELAANLFRTTQAEDKLRREKIKGKVQANYAHHEVGKKVR